MIARFPFLHTGQEIKVFSFLCCSCNLEFASTSSFPMSFSLFWNCWAIFVIVSFAFCIISFSLSSKLSFAEVIDSISFSNSLVRFSSIIIGEYFSSVEINDMPKGVASMLFSFMYPLS